MNFKYLLFFVVFLFSNKNFAQYTATDVRHYIKVEGAWLKNYLSTLSDKTTQLQMHDNGTNVNLIWGWDFDERVNVGIGAGYIQLDTHRGLNLYGDVSFFVSNGIVNPFIGIRAGYDMIWPYNTDGQGSVLGEFMTGIKIRLSRCHAYTLYLQSGLLYTQNNLYFPVRVGFSI